MKKVYIYGKVKRKKDLVRILYNEEKDVYEVPDLSSVVEYNPNTLLEEGQFYYLSDFSDTKYAIAFIKDEIDSVNHSQIIKEELQNLSYICTIQDDFYYFQVINKNSYIYKKWYSIQEMSLKENAPILIINDYADVIYDKKSNKLYFKKLSLANNIFKGMNELYREATISEVEEFFKNDFLAVNTNFTHSKVSIQNRKRIALAIDTYNSFNEKEKKEIHNYIEEYTKGKITFKKGKFTINDNNDLQDVLWGIEQKYYTTKVGSEKRVANSIISL